MMSTAPLNEEELRCLIGLGMDISEKNKPKNGFWRLFELGLVDIDVDRDTLPEDEIVDADLTHKGRALIRALPSETRHRIADELLISSVKADLPTGATLGRAFNLLTGWVSLVEEAIREEKPLDVSADDLREIEQARDDVGKVMDQLKSNAK